MTAGASEPRNQVTSQHALSGLNAANEAWKVEHRGDHLAR
jgi:hypothetical protein